MDMFNRLWYVAYVLDEERSRCQTSTKETIYKDDRYGKDTRTGRNWVEGTERRKWKDVRNANMGNKLVTVAKRLKQTQGWTIICNHELKKSQSNASWSLYNKYKKIVIQKMATRRIHTILDHTLRLKWRIKIT